MLHWLLVFGFLASLCLCPGLRIRQLSQRAPGRLTFEFGGYQGGELRCRQRARFIHTCDPIRQNGERKHLLFVDTLEGPTLDGRAPISL